MARPTTNVSFSAERTRYVIQKINKFTINDVAKRVIPGDSSDENKLRRFRQYLHDGNIPHNILFAVSQLLNCSYDYLRGTESKTPQEYRQKLTNLVTDSKYNQWYYQELLENFHKFENRIDDNGFFVGLCEYESKADLFIQRKTFKMRDYTFTSCLATTKDGKLHLCSDVLGENDYFYLSCLVDTLLCAYTDYRLKFPEHDPREISIPLLIESGLLNIKIEEE